MVSSGINDGVPGFIVGSGKWPKSPTLLILRRNGLQKCSDRADCDLAAGMASEFADL